MSLDPGCMRVVWDFCPILNWCADNLEIQPTSLITVHVSVSWALPRGFRSLQCRRCINPPAEQSARAVILFLFFSAHLVVMLCVCFQGRGAYLGLHTVRVMHRDGAAEDLWGWGIEDILSLTVFNIKTNMDVSLIKGPIHYIQWNYNKLCKNQPITHIKCFFLREAQL